ncbi:MAG: nickel transporter permease [Methanohalobium sp.]
MKKIINNRSMFIGIIILSSLLFIAIFSGFFAPHEPDNTNLDKRLEPASREYPLGTDHMGRCILSRILFGTRVTLFIGLSVVLSSLTIGLVVGTLSGYYGGIPDEIIMRIVDGFLAFPSMFLALAIAGIFDGGISSLIFALVLVEWTSYARVARSSVLSIKKMEFIEAAKGLGGNDTYVIVKHVIPNILSPLIVIATLGMGYVILASAGLSFLGLGVQSYPDWGLMINEGREFIQRAPYIMLFPGIAIMITVMGFNFLGDGIRDKLDPRGRDYEYP